MNWGSSFYKRSFSNESKPHVWKLHDRLHPIGVFVGHLSISPLIKKGTGFDPDQVAEAWYNLYETRTDAEDTFPKGIMQFIN